MRGSTLPFASTKTYGLISINLRDKLKFLTLLSLPFSRFLSSLKLIVPFFFFQSGPFSPFLTFLPSFFFSFFFIFPFYFSLFLSFSLFFFSHLVLIQLNSPVAPLPFLLNFHFFSFSLLFHLTFFPLFLHLTHGSI